MIALFKRTPRPEIAAPQVPEASELAAIVARIDAIESETHRELIGAYAVQIRELARAIEKERTFGQSCIRDIPAAEGDTENLGEGYWELVLAENSSKHIGRYAREARHWLKRHTRAIERLETGQRLEPWLPEDRYDDAISIERTTMEAAQ